MFSARKCRWLPGGNNGGRGSPAGGCFCSCRSRSTFCPARASPSSPCSAPSPCTSALAPPSPAGPPSDVSTPLESRMRLRPSASPPIAQTIPPALPPPADVLGYLKWLSGRADRFDMYYRGNPSGLDQLLKRKPGYGRQWYIVCGFFSDSSAYPLPSTK